MGGLFQLFLGYGDFQELGHHPLFGLLRVPWNCHGTSGCVISLLIEDQGLIKVDLSAMLDPFDSVQFMLCPWATSFFQKWCPAPFPPVTKLSVQLITQSCPTLCNPMDYSTPGLFITNSQRLLKLMPIEFFMPIKNSQHHHQQVSITSDMQITPPLWQKVKKN